MAVKIVISDNYKPSKRNFPAVKLISICTDVNNCSAFGGFHRNTGNVAKKETSVICS